LKRSALDTIRIGTRGSKLAKIQTDLFISNLAKHKPDIAFQVINVTTIGDKVRDRPIAAVGGTGIFVKELEDALLNNEVDIVIHSLKDLPTELPQGLTLACVSNREDPRDVLIASKGRTFAQLPAKSRVATSSRRRAAQLLAIRQDVTFIDIRGNVPTRVRKQEEGECEAIVLAAAGLVRLGLEDKISQYFDYDICLPAAGQGALGIECRVDDLEIVKMLKELDDPSVRSAVTAERSFLAELGGGCSVPVGALAIVTEDTVLLRGCIASLDGKEVVRDQLSGPSVQCHELGKKLASLMIQNGAAPILAQLRLSCANAISPP
jgi:hydroxymethylbilane synthase